jgi:glutamate synthase domain-containing protein 2
VKVGASHQYYDVALAVKSGADAIVLDGMQGGTAASQEVFIEHVGIPILAAIPDAVQSLVDLGLHREVQLIVSGGIRTGADVAKALALGADAVSIGVAALIALGDNAPEHEAGYARIGSAAGFYDDWQAGLDPAGISTQEPELAVRLDAVEGGRRLSNYLRTLTLEAQTLARQVARAQPRARGSGRAYDRGGRDGAGAARGHNLDPGQHPVAARDQPSAAAAVSPWRRNVGVKLGSVSAGRLIVNGAIG